MLYAIQQMPIYFFLIDDTNNEEEIESRTFTNKHNFNIEVRFLHPENLDV